jgi:hypothetical protein
LIFSTEPVGNASQAFTLAQCKINIVPDKGPFSLLDYKPLTSPSSVGDTGKVTTTREFSAMFRAALQPSGQAGIKLSRMDELVLPKIGVDYHPQVQVGNQQDQENFLTFPAWNFHVNDNNFKERGFQLQTDNQTDNLMLPGVTFDTSHHNPSLAMDTISISVDGFYTRGSILGLLWREKVTVGWQNFCHQMRIDIPIQEWPKNNGLRILSLQSKEGNTSKYSASSPS